MPRTSVKEALRNVTFRQLQIFLMAAEHESYAKAADLLHLTQPAVSMQMKRLAEMAEVDLFVKSGRELRLTSAGKTLLPYVRQITQTLKEAGEEIDAIKGVRHGSVKVGMVTTTQYFSPGLIMAFNKRYPEIELDVTIANRRDIVSKLEENELDVAIMGRPPRGLEVNSEKFYDHPYVMIAPKSHYLARQRAISAKQLQGETFLVRENGSGTRLLLEHYLLEYNLVPPKFIQFARNESIKQGVMAGMGLAIISAHTIHLEKSINLLQVLDVEEMPIMRDWYVLHLQSRMLSPAAEAFKSFMQADAPNLLDGMFAN
ncbi:MAG: LysR substrate-binding domain-containing protein [Kangiellaceae bacterium]|jgi:DNA-binding transcriptional LysR family regulator|nr:LysR substrate-binding domain-containing protein [Kangiellaceae bacterium]